MPAKVSFSVGPIDPRLVYSLPQIAAALDITSRNFRERFIHTRLVRHCQYAPNKYSIPGEAWIAYVRENLEGGESDATDI